MKRIILTPLFLCILHAAAQNYNYYFGNLHSHTGFSDGCKDSASSGVSDPTGAYTYAKLSQHFDFLGISEHNHYSSARNPGFKRPLYQKGLDMADTANKDAGFLAWFGMEWGVSSNYNGHLIIYGFDHLIGWESGVPGIPGVNYDIYNGKTDYDGIFRKIKNNPNAFCYLAHPYNTDFSTNGTSATALANAPYNAMYDSAIVGMPLRSGDAFSTFTDYSDYPTGDYFSYYKKLLAKDYHLGIGYDHDNHNTTFGRNNAGRLVIMAPSLTRTSLTAAMQQMRFYGSDDWNAKIDFNMDNHVMGSIVSGTTDPTFNVIHNDGDGEQVKTIRLWKGNSNTSGIYPVVVKTVSNNNTLTYTDTGLTPGIEYYYFAEIVQADGDWIVTSPIWYKNSSPGSTVSIPEQMRTLKFNYFPNPASRHLNISIADPGAHTISIVDISGREVFKHLYEEKDLVIDLATIEAGIYTLLVKGSTSSVSGRLVIE